jgi:hypothetical protein
MLKQFFLKTYKKQKKLRFAKKNIAQIIFHKHGRLVRNFSYLIQNGSQIRLLKYKVQLIDQFFF